METCAVSRLAVSSSPLLPQRKEPRQTGKVYFCVRSAAWRWTAASAPSLVSTEKPGTAVTDCSSPGGDGFYGNGGNWRHPFFSGEEEEENPWNQLRSIAGGRVPEMMKNVKEEEEAAYASLYSAKDTYTGIMIGSCCGLIGELWKRGKGFLVGMVCNFSLLASYLLLSHPFSSGGDIGGPRHAFASLSSSAIGSTWLDTLLLPYKQKIFDYLFQAIMDNLFKAARSACENSVKRIIGTRTSKGVMLGCALCIVGQGAANLISSAKVPPNVIMTAALCGGLLFFVVKEIRNELNEASSITEKKVPLVPISEMISPAAKAKWFPTVPLKITAVWQSSYHAYDAMEYDYLSAHGARFRRTGSGDSSLRLGLSVTIPLDLLGLW